MSYWVYSWALSDVLYVNIDNTVPDGCVVVFGDRLTRLPGLIRCDDEWSAYLDKWWLNCPLGRYIKMSLDTYNNLEESPLQKKPF